MEISKNEWDVIVVGTGPSGAAVARDLAKNKKRVLILERGKEDLSLNIPRMLKNKEMLFLGKYKTLVRGIRTGGTSIFYYGTAFQPPLDLFLRYGIDLSNEVEEIKKELPIAPLRNDLIGPAAKMIMKSAVSLGYPWKSLDKFIYQDLCTSKHFPFEAQWNSTLYIKEALENGASILDGSEVKKVIINNRKAAGVEFVKDGNSRKVFASRIVLAAGGLSSANILRSSGVSGAGDGFFCDPLIISQGLVEDVDAGNEIPMASGMICSEEGYVLTDITLPKLVYQLFTAQALRFHRIFDHHKTISVMVKIKDSIGGNINSKGNISKKFTKEDRYKMSQGLLVANKILKHAGAKRIFRSAWTAAHPGGSARIGEVVDSNLQTEYKNLYVCDCSVIPTPWGLPPTFTLLSLAKRLSKHLISTDR